MLFLYAKPTPRLSIIENVFPFIMIIIKIELKTN